MYISLFTLLIIIYLIIIARVIYKIIISYDNTNPIKTTAWILAILLLPIIGLIAYVILGRNLSKKRSYFRKLSDEIKEHGYFEYGFDAYKQNNDELLNEYSYLKTLLRNLYPLPVFTNNNVDLYASGKEKFKHLFEDLEKAKYHIHILYYTIGNDTIGNEFKDILIKKKKEGLEVRVMYDDMGCNQTHKCYFKQMEKAGIEMAVFSPIRFPRLFRTVNYRNHKKIVVIDGKIAYTGGINVKDEYVNGLKWGLWRDVHLRVEGSGAQGFQTVFAIDWFYTCNKFLFLEEYYPVVGNFGTNPLQIVTSEPIDQFKNIMQGMIEAIMRAKESVYIETPYFVPSDSLLTAIQCAGLSGLDVRLVMPDRSDNMKVQYAANSYVMQLLESKVKVYRYLPGFIHSKLMLIDDELVIAGSSNMDMRSLELNFETNVFIYDRETALKAKEIIMKDMDDSALVNISEWKNRSRRTRFVESVFRLFSPLL